MSAGDTPNEAMEMMLEGGDPIPEPFAERELSCEALSRLGVSLHPYKNYTALIEFDKRDNIFVGRGLGISDVTSFHGASFTDFRAEFERAVGGYLADRAENAA